MKNFFEIADTLKKAAWKIRLLFIMLQLSIGKRVPKDKIKAV